MYDVVIIGGGIVGSSVAYYLSKYQLKTVLLITTFPMEPPRQTQQSSTPDMTLKKEH